MANATLSRLGFHARADAQQHYFGNPIFKQTTGFTYTFENGFHPFVGELIEKLNRESLRGMLDPDFHQSLTAEFFDDFYTALNSRVVTVEQFPKEIELHAGGAYTNYNWELLFHIPLAIAVHLSKNQRFAEAQRWFHYIFDPTSNDTSVPVPQRFWKFLAFRTAADPTRIEALLALLSKLDPNPEEERLRETILQGYEAIRNDPFQPHAVARTRQVAYQYSVVMKYLDNLIAWGDSLFRQDTIESLNEATQRYVLAANLLGPRPERIPPRGSARPKTYAELKQQGLDVLGNALVDLEGQLPFNLSLPLPQEGDADAATPLFGIGRTLYFCVPHNEKLIGYWDTVGDRLFKIRNCLNIEGVFRELELFGSPLDSGLLVKAAAAGIDIRSMVNGLNQPVGPLRCFFLIQKALELAAEVRGMGSALLAAIEKGDGERMALLRQGHEITIQQMALDVRFLQWKGAQESTESLLCGRASALERFNFHRRLLGLELDEEAAPETLTLDRRELTEENFDEAHSALVDRYAKAVPEEGYPTLRRAPESAADLIALTLQTGNLHLNLHEFLELNVLAPAAQVLRTLAAGTETTAAALAPLPDASIDLHYWGLGGHAGVSGGSKSAEAAGHASRAVSNLADLSESAASYVSKAAGYQRRADEWRLQHNLAARELMQIGRQILGALIAEQIAHHEYLSLQKQIEQSQEVDRFLREKFTNAELFAWMQGEISRLYYEYYRFAFDTARKAEQAMKYELMRPEVDATEFIKFNYWDGGRKGLLSGEALYLDVKRLEMAYHENNKREYELSKHVSLRQLDPVALLTLKATGTCEVSLPEWLFDLDGPGHYLRRLKAVSVSHPSVTGPLTSITCTLSLLKSSVRTSPLLRDDEYARQVGEDERFVDTFGAIQSIVTSSGNNDSGLFETNLHEERFLPFEGAGAISTWRLELPDTFRQFDYNTISDVIVHVRYTARQGGDQVRQAAVQHLEALIEEASTSGLAQLFSLRHDFPSEWHRFVTGDAVSPFAATIKKEFFPYFGQSRDINITGIEMYALTDDGLAATTPGQLDLSALSDELHDEKAFDLTLAEDAVLKRDKDARVFLVIKYAANS
jgi:hypothetical protein